MLAGFPDPRRLALRALVVVVLSAALGVGLGYAISAVGGGPEPVPALGLPRATDTPSCLRALALSARAPVAGGRRASVRICLRASVPRRGAEPSLA